MYTMCFEHVKPPFPSNSSCVPQYLPFLFMTAFFLCVVTNTYEWLTVWQTLVLPSKHPLLLALIYFVCGKIPPWKEKSLGNHLSQREASGSITFLGIVTKTCDSSTQKSEAGDQPRPQSQILTQTHKIDCCISYPLRNISK